MLQKEADIKYKQVYSKAKDIEFVEQFAKVSKKASAVKKSA